MPIDASIYQNIRPVEIPSPLDAAQKGMALSQLGMQQMQMSRQMQTQQAVQGAYGRNMDQNGNLDKGGFLSDLAKVSPMAAMDYKNQFIQQDKQQAEAKAAQLDAAQKAVGIAFPAMDYLAGLPENQRAAAYPNVMKQIGDQGVDISQMPHEYDPGHFRQTYLIGQKMKPALENALTQAQTEKTLAEAEKTKSETYKRNPDILGQTDDPAKLVPGYVPKEHQAKAYAEIDAAENTRKMSQSIMDSFEQAVDDTRGIGRITSLVKAPRSAQALHQAMQPTFKDLEGTVRQAAMDNTFKNITPNAGDTAGDIQTKRQALQDYLQSKLSAPTARAYGIDLSKFQSTAPYQGSKANASQGNPSTGPKNAYAAPPAISHGTVEDGYIFMGGDPGNQKSWKRVK